MVWGGEGRGASGSQLGGPGRGDAVHPTVASDASRQAQEQVDDVWVKLGSGAAFQFANDPGHWLAGSVGSITGHGIHGVSQTEDSRCQGRFGGAASEWVAVAVPTLVVAEDNIQQVSADPGQSEEVAPDLRVLLNDRVLGVSQSASLEEDSVRDPKFPDVVHFGRGGQQFQLRLWESRSSTDRAGDPRDSSAMPQQATALRFDEAAQGGQLREGSRRSIDPLQLGRGIDLTLGHS